MLTIDYFKTHPLRIAKPHTTLTLGQLRAREHAATSIMPDLHPTAGAYIHYGGVELADMLTITKPPLSQAELETLAYNWHASCGVVAKHLLFYVWRIITKEMRHGNSGMMSKAFGGGGYDPEAVALCNSVCGEGVPYETLLDSHPGLNAIEYVRAVEQQFRHGGWGGAFGGKKWADIALVFLRYLQGETSAMIAADRAWTLVHNTGPIFNKGFYFKLHDTKLIQVLEAQAKASVFHMGDDFLTAYPHSVNAHFYSFKAAAVSAIQKVQPDYTAGKHGGVNADGGAFALEAITGGSKVTHSGKAVGPFSIPSTTREDITHG